MTSMASSGDVSKPLLSTSPGSPSSVPGPQPASHEATWVSNPNPGAARPSLRTLLAHTETLDEAGGPPRAPVEADATSPYVRRYTADVTQEHPSRYRVPVSSADVELGRGGIGRVFVAHDAHLGREVAIKELLPEVLDAQSGPGALNALSRFLREARVTGALEHPNIVPVYELGRRADGTVYYTMRVVRGRTLARAIRDAAHLTQRLQLVNHFFGMCQAVAYAHSRGIVHRDLKPDNVMIGEFGETVVLDWGMAKLCGAAVGADPTEAAAPIQNMAVDLTAEGSFCGTPIYMSPEQALGLTREVDERSDVWSLGAVLYTLLAGRPPFAGRTLPEIIEQVKAAAFIPLRQLDPAIPAELAAVVERALQPESARRYASARDLARDVEAYQAGARVGAYEYSSLELLQRFVARQRSAVIASLLGLAVVVVLSAAAYRRLIVARDRAVSAEQRALENALAAKKSEHLARHSLGEVLVERAAQAMAEGDTLRGERLAAQALAQQERADARGIVLAAHSSMRPQPASLVAETGGCRLASLVNQRFVCAKADRLQLWDLRSGTALWQRQLESEVVAVALNGTGSLLALACADGSVRLQSSQTAGAPVLLATSIAEPAWVAVSEHGDWVAAGSASGQLSLWETRTGRVQWRQQLGQAVSALAFAPTSNILAFGGVLGLLGTWDIERRQRLDFTGHAGTVRALAFAQRGRYLASAGTDRSVRFWDATTGQQPLAPLVHTDALTALDWSEDGRYLAFGSKDKSFRITDLRSSSRSVLVKEHDEAVELVAFAPDLNELTSFSKDVGLRRWSLPSLRRPNELTDRGNVLALDFINGEELVSGGLGQNGICVWDLRNGSCSTRLPARLEQVRALALSPDTSVLALAGSERQVFLWDMTRRVPSHVLEGSRDQARALSFSPDGRQLAVAGLEGVVRLFDARTAELKSELLGKVPLQSASFVPGKDQLVAGDREGFLAVWQLTEQRLAHRFRAHADWVLSTAVTADGQRIASAGADRKVKLWDTRTRALLLELSGHTGKVLSVDFSPDDQLLASAGEDKTVRLWRSTTGTPLALLRGHDAAVRTVRFHPTGKTLASGSDDGTIRLWRLDAISTPSQELLRTLHPSN